MRYAITISGFIFFKVERIVRRDFAQLKIRANRPALLLVIGKDHSIISQLPTVRMDSIQLCAFG